MSERYEAPKKRIEEKEPAGFYDYATQAVRIRTDLLWKQLELAYDKVSARGSFVKNELAHAEHALIGKIKASDRYIVPREEANRERKQGRRDAREAGIGFDETGALSTYLNSTAALYRENINHIAEDVDRTLVVPKVLVEVEEHINRAFPKSDLDASETLNTLVTDFKGKLAAARNRFSSVITAHPSDMRSPEYDEEKDTQITRDYKRANAMLSSVASLHKEMKQVEGIYKDTIARISAAGGTGKPAKPLVGKSPLSMETRTASGALDALPDTELRALARFKGFLEQELINNIHPYAAQKRGAYYELGRAMQTHVQTGKKLRAAEVQLEKMYSVRSHIYEQRESKREKLQQRIAAQASRRTRRSKPKDDFARAFFSAETGTPLVKEERTGWGIGITPGTRPDEEAFISEVMRLRKQGYEATREADIPESDAEEDVVEETPPVVETRKEPEPAQPVPVQRNEKAEPETVAAKPAVAVVQEESKRKSESPKVQAESKETKRALKAKQNAIQEVIKKLGQKKIAETGRKNTWATVLATLEKTELPDEARKAVQKYVAGQEALKKGLQVNFGPKSRTYLIDVLKQAKEGLR